MTLHDPQTEPLYTFALWMLGARGDALENVHRVLAEEQDPGAQLRTLIARLVAAERSGRIDRFAELDDKLRSNFTIPVDLDHPLVMGDAGRLNVLLRELQRGCLGTALRGVAPLRRAVFVLRHVLGYSLERCAELCNATPEAVYTTAGRARRELEDYLGVRCEHLDSRNPCHCVDRLGNALECGLVDWPEHHDHDTGQFLPRGHRDVTALYASLPRVHLPVVPDRV